MLYTAEDVRRYLHPSGPVGAELHKKMARHVAYWVREYDPEFSSMHPYPWDDDALAEDWMMIVKTGGLTTVIHRLEQHLMEKING